MFYDLNVQWSANGTQLQRTLAFLHEIGYNVVALNHSISGKLSNDLTCPIPDPLPFEDDLPKNFTILRRCTLTLTETHQNARLAALAQNYDILALRPIDEKSLSLACTSLDCDIISLDLTQRLPYWFKFKMIKEAVKAGKRFEMCYAQGVMDSSGSSSGARRNLISNATQLIRASRGRGLIISSEAKSAVACRGPWDVINLAAVWGLGQEKGYEAVSKECRTVVVSAKLKRTSYRGVIDVIYGGEKSTPAATKDAEEADARHDTKQVPKGQKRKAGTIEDDTTGARELAAEKPMSKRAMKRLKKAERLQAASDTNGGATDGAANPAEGLKAADDNT